MSLSLWSSILGLLGSFLLVIPALRADSYLSAAHFNQGVIDAIKALPGDESKDSKEQLKIANAFHDIVDQMQTNSKKWTICMSRTLKMGVVCMLLSGLLRIFSVINAA